MHIRPASLCFLVTCGLFFGPLHGQGAPTSEDLYAQAYDEFLKRDYTTASRLLDQINPEEQKKTDILNLRGAIYKRLGELDNAANAFNDALKINPKDWVPKFNLAEINFLRGEYPTARNFLQEALAAMPEADRMQKQDLVLYKVYLTRLLEGDTDKAKLMLDGFDMNSPNPIYYFGQAAWNFKNKEDDKARILIESTEGLYSEELRNAYGQALVDIGWMEPLSGVKKVTTVAAAPAATASPGSLTLPVIDPPPAATPEVKLIAASTPVATATPTASPAASTDQHAAVVKSVPLAVVGEKSAPATADTQNAAAEPSAAPEKTGNAENSPKSSSATRVILLALLVLATAGVALLFLGRRSRFESDPIAGPDRHSSDPDAPQSSPLTENVEEGTGAVREQEATGLPLGEPVKVRPIGLIPREESAKTETVAAKSSEPAATRKTSSTGGKSRTAKPKASTTSRKKSPVTAAAEIALVGAAARAATKAITSRSKTSGAKAAPAPAKTSTARVLPVAAKVTTKIAPAAKPAEKPLPPTKAAPTAPAKKPAAKPPATRKAAAAPIASRPAKAKAPVAAPTAAPAPTPIPARAPEPAPIPAPAALAAEIPPTAPVAAPANRPATPAPAPKAAAPARPAMKTRRSLAPLIPPTVRPTTPLITIPEFEDGFVEARESTPILRIVPSKIPDDVQNPPPSTDSPERL